jgi:peptidyl-tRNA hydrolase
VINALGSSDFSRIRIGIGSVGKENQIDHVLSEFDESEKIIFKQVETIAVDAAMLALSRGVTAAMDSFNGIFISGDESLEDNKR